jgi:hypothetical protein
MEMKLLLIIEDGKLTYPRYRQYQSFTNNSN